MEPANNRRYDQVPQLQEANDSSSSAADLPPTTITTTSDDHSSNASDDGEVQLSSTNTTRSNRRHGNNIVIRTADNGETNQHQEEEDLEHLITVDEAMERLGMGPFQRYILVASGLCFASDAMQVVLLSFLTVVLQSDWNLSDEEGAAITSAIFLGDTCVGTIG